MKVLATEDVKVVVEEKGPSEGTRSPFNQEYELKPEPRNYVNFSKLVLLSLAIIASFLLCLIFARDLWGQKGEKEKYEVAHPQRQMHRVTDGPSHFPFMDDFLENLQDLPFGKESHGRSDEVDPKVVSKITKISFRVLPSDSSEPLAHNQIENSRPSGLNDPVEDMMKMMMSMFDDMQPQHQSHMVERPSMFSDLPMFNHEPNSVHHPKLIIVRKLNPTITQAPKEDDFFKNILDGLFNPPKASNQQHDDPFSFFPLQPAHHKPDPLEDGLDKAFPFLKNIMIRPKPVVSVQIRSKPTTPKPNNESPESWKQYKHLVSDVAESVDTLLDDASSLKDLVKEAVSKMESATAPAETTEAASESNAESKEQPITSQPQASIGVLPFLKNAEELLNKMGVSLTEASVLIKTEDGALDLVNRTDKEGLKHAIDSFIKSIHSPLDEVYEASTKLTKINGNEKEMPEEIYSGIVKLGKGLIHFGKLIYEKMADLKKSVDNLEPTKPAVEPKTTDSDSKTSENEDVFSTPILSRRIVFFNGSPNSLTPLKIEDSDTDKTVTP